MTIAIVETPHGVFNCPWDELGTSAIPNALVMWPASRSPIFLPFAEVSRIEKRVIA